MAVPSRRTTCCGVRSIKTCGDATHDYRAETAVRGTIRSGDVSVSSQFQNAELLGQETAIALFDGFFGPLINVRVPNWAVISGRGGNATECVVGTMSVQESGAQTLTLRILATAFGLAVRGDEDPLHGATTDVIDPGFDSAQTRSEGIPLNSRHSGITGLSGDVEDGLAKAISVDQREGDGPVRRINRDYLIMYEAVVGISVRKIYECIVYSSGDNGRVVNDAVDEHQWAIVLIADRARLRDAGWEGLLLRAGHNLAIRTEVHEAGVEQKRPVGAARSGASGIACVMQFLGEVHAKALRFCFIACVKDDVPGGFQARRCVHRTLVEGQGDRSYWVASGNIDSCQLLDGNVELTGFQELDRPSQIWIRERVGRRKLRNVDLRSDRGQGWDDVASGTRPVRCRPGTIPSAQQPAVSPLFSLLRRCRAGQKHDYGKGCCKDARHPSS